MADFPSSIPNFTNLDGTKTLAENNHAARHNKVHDELTAVATKLGTTGSANNSTVDYKLQGVTGSAKAESQANKSPSTSLAPNDNTSYPTTAGVKSYIDTQIATAIATAKSQAKSELFPVGSIYTNSVNNTNPATLLGFGTWVAFGAGRVPVGFDSGQTEFDTAEETGGSKTDTHWHWQTVGGDGAGIYANNAGGYLGRSRVVIQPRGVSGTNNNSVNNTREDGTYDANTSTLQPYITVYMWKRTA